MGRVGLEPTTLALKGRYSTIELPTHTQSLDQTNDLPILLVSSLATMTICTPHYAFVNSCFDGLPRPFLLDHARYLFCLNPSHVIELQNQRVGLAAVVARVLQ